MRSDELLGKELPGHDGELFTITKFIDNGSFGYVFKAVGNDSGIAVAVKTAMGDAIKTLANEIKHALMVRKHKNVVSYLHVEPEGSDEIGPYIMMEFVDGGTLFHFIADLKQRNEPFPYESALEIMRGVACGMKAINENIIHRDMKPDNVLLETDNDFVIPRITDFGLSKNITESTRSETFKGIQAIAYKPPEVWKGETATAKLDAYSTGLIFYEILLLEHPLLRFIANPMSPRPWEEWERVHLGSICDDVREHRADVDTPIAELLSAMTNKQPERRPDWDEILRVLSLEESDVLQAEELPVIELSPDLVNAFKRHNQEVLTTEQKKTEENRLKMAEDHQLQLQRQEYSNSFAAMIQGFDAIITALNQISEGKEIDIYIEGGNRRYKMPSGRFMSIQDFGYRTVANSIGPVIGGGYIGTDGGLSANIALYGSRDNIPIATWNGIEVTMPLIIGPKRIELYRRANISDATARFVEYVDHDKPWRRNAPGFFGIRDVDLFFSKAGQNALDVYQLRLADLRKTFEAILTVALDMPPS